MNARPYLLGLTGSIAMGKSTTAQMFRDAGVPVWDADATVHRLYQEGGAAVTPVAALVPDALKDGAIDRTALSAAIRRDPSLLDRLEKIVHPLVQQDRAAFVAAAQADVVVLDIPLLYETGAEKECDAVLVVTAPPEVQRDRVLSRPGMTEDRFESLLFRQMPDADKRARADFVVDTSRGLEAARADVHSVLETVRSKHA